ncbi:MAG: nucleotide sugar dehydrogenase [Candidatus Omnitrophica bacterium]|nr:nucleotide sugar dehydrogenase [Candidatus Omnitrophota bacterium]
MKNDLRKGLIEGKYRLGIWGLGYIGYSSAAYFAKAGVRCLGNDVIAHRVRDINKGHETIHNLELWLGFKIKDLVDKKLIRATLDWKKLISKDIPVHLVAIPTEKSGQPYDKILIDVIGKLCNFKKIKMSHPPVVIIESTLTPNKVEQVVIPLFESKGLKVGKDILLGVAPRRDWFISPEKTLVTLPRVVGGTNEYTTKLIHEILSIVCRQVIDAPDHRHAEMVKSIENAYRHLDIALANQLSLAYPNINMLEVLRLVGTKWNVGTFQPSFGTGGYCIPLAPQYVLEGAQFPERLTLLKDAIITDSTQPINVARSVLARGAKNVGVLGLAYKGDIPVTILSPAIPIIQTLQQAKIKVKVYDPYFRDKNVVAQKTGLKVDTFAFPQGLGEFDTILIISDHSEFKFTNTVTIKNNLKKCRLILDNPGVWSNLHFDEKIKYYRAGHKDWILGLGEGRDR